MATIWPTVIATVLGTVIAALLAALVRGVASARRDVRWFMAEHLWLIAHAQWSQKTIAEVLTEFGMKADPPPEMAKHRK